MLLSKSRPARFGLRFPEDRIQANNDCRRRLFLSIVRWRPGPVVADVTLTSLGRGEWVQLLVLAARGGAGHKGRSIIFFGKAGFNSVLQSLTTWNQLAELELLVA